MRRRVFVHLTTNITLALLLGSQLPLAWWLRSCGMRTVLLGELEPPVKDWLERRRALGQDRFDEVWEREYHVTPAPAGPHAYVDHQLAGILRPRAVSAGLWGTTAINVGESQNFRVPDQAYLRERPSLVFHATAAIVVEVVSPGDETYPKFEFYFARAIEELLVVDPSTRAVEWYRRGQAGFERSGRSELLGLAQEELAAEIDWPPAGDQSEATD